MFPFENRIPAFLAALPLICATITSATAAERSAPLFLTATNGTGLPNYLAVINTRTQETSYVPTGGMGGASGNAGGVAGSCPRPRHNPRARIRAVKAPRLHAHFRIKNSSGSAYSTDLALQANSGHAPSTLSAWQQILNS